MNHPDLYVEKDLKNNVANTCVGLLLLLRPKQWTKNLLVFAAYLFSFRSMEPNQFLRVIWGFLIYCFISGCVYIINDYVDRESDRNHPKKKHRPLASGRIKPLPALGAGLVLLLASLGSAFLLSLQFGLVTLIYLLTNLAYSLYLKHIVILDVMLIAAGFVLRAIGGGVVIGVPFTPWFLLCTLLLALFLAISKRRHELVLLHSNKAQHRKVLATYSVSFLDQLIGIVTTATIITYALFTFTSGHTIQLMWTIPVVLYGIFRYLYLVSLADQGGAPEEVLIQDKPILFTVALYGLMVVMILSYFE